MFWGCFSYDQKGTCHCWLPETRKEKETASARIDDLNRDLELIMRAQLELEVGMRRLIYVACVGGVCITRPCAKRAQTR
jgi:hypothetical protein